MPCTTSNAYGNPRMRRQEERGEGMLEEIPSGSCMNLKTNASLQNQEAQSTLQQTPTHV